MLKLQEIHHRYVAAITASKKNSTLVDPEVHLNVPKKTIQQENRQKRTLETLITVTMTGCACCSSVNEVLQWKRGNLVAVRQHL